MDPISSGEEIPKNVGLGKEVFFLGSVLSLESMVWRRYWLTGMGLPDKCERICWSE